MNLIVERSGRALLWCKLVVCGVALTLLGCGSNSSGRSESVAEATIVDVAIDNSDFSILVEAVVAAELQELLSGEGPFTVFAPTNSAFVALLGELGITKEQLLANVPLLKEVLAYHVVAGAVSASMVPLGAPITSLQGGYFKIDDRAGSLVVTDGRNRSSTVRAVDVEASNGVIHVVDAVLLPADRNIVETALALSEGDPAEFTLLVEAVLAAELDGVLSGPGPFTVFAPTDAAFSDLLGELGVRAEDLLGATELLTAVLAYHVVPALVLAAQVPVGQPIATVQGETFTVGADLAITDQRGRRARIVATDVLTENGVVHVIDRVILPSS